MEEHRFDTLVRSLTGSRRAVVAGALGLGALTLPGLVEAKRKKRKKRKKKQKITFNDFGCVNVGSFCQDSDQCCSGICAGKKGKQTCQAHDQSTCQAGQDYCSGGQPLPCDTSANESGLCVRTTGNASYCEARAGCFACSEDADCVPFCGPRAACIVCDESCAPIGTACASVENFGCNFS